MATKTEPEARAREIRAPSLHENSRRSPAALRARVVEWARLAALCAEVDIGEPTLPRFLGTARWSERSAGFTRLQLSSARPEPMTVTRAVVLRGLCGVTAEGLSIDDVARAPKGVDDEAARLKDEANSERLREKALVLARENERLSTKVVELMKENLTLEGMSPDQLQQTLALLDEELRRVKGQQPAPAATTERRHYGAPPPPGEQKPKTGHGPRAQPSLPVEPVVHDVDEADRACVECGGQLEWWEEQDDETEEVDVVERHFVMKRHGGRKHRRRCGRSSNDFAVEVAVRKSLDGLPLEPRAGAHHGARGPHRRIAGAVVGAD